MQNREKKTYLRVKELMKRKFEEDLKRFNFDKKEISPHNPHHYFCGVNYFGFKVKKS